jgi:hypothetical protein
LFSANGVISQKAWGNAPGVLHANISAEGVSHRPGIESRFQRWPGDITEILGRCPKLA